MLTKQCSQIVTSAQIFDVVVGPNGVRVFAPSSVNISVGDTVRWTWASDNHNAASGSPCSANGQFRSPNNTNCSAGILSNTGTVIGGSENLAAI